MSSAETLSPTLPDDIEDLARKVAQAACDLDFRLVTAESCTGGLLASLLTDIDGCAHAFDRGVVAYTHAAKAELLGVPRSVLETDGAVSAACAHAMAEGALLRSQGDIAVAVTGFTGPGGPGDEPGLVYFGLAGRGQTTQTDVRRFGDIGRGPTRIACLRVALQLFDGALDQ